MLTLTGNGHLTRDVELCTTRTGKHVATVSVASDRRDRQAGALYVDLILWERQAEAAAEHLVKGQAAAFAGRFEPRTYTDRDGREHVAYELHDVMLEYGVRATTEAFGVMTLSVPHTCSLQELREELHEFVFEEDLLELDDDLGDEPRWEELSSALRKEAVIADDAALLALPFVIEVDDQVSARLSR
jgi:hypothetical protein